MARRQWHEVRHRVTGTVEHVASLDGYPEDEWDATPLRRAPRAHERHVGGGRLQRDTEASAREAARARYHLMDKADLILTLDRVATELAAVTKRLAILEEKVR